MRSRNAIRNVFTNLILQVIIILNGFIIPKIIISNYGSSVNGLISSITQFLGYISLLQSGLGPVVKAALYKPIADKNTDEIAHILKSAEKFFRTIAAIFILYIILLIVFYPIIINNQFGFLYTSSLIVIISISIFAEYFFGMTYRLYLQAEQKTYVISLIQIVTYILSIIFIVLFVKLNFSIHIVKLISGLIFVIKPLLQNIYVRKKYSINLKNVDNNCYDLKNKWDGLSQHIAAVIHDNTDITVLTIFTDLVEVSVYSVYRMVVRGVRSIVESFITGIDASFGDMMAKNEYDNLRRKFNLYEIIYFTVGTIIFSCTLLLINPFVIVYSRDITDAIYLRSVFGYLFVISELLYVLRLPYHYLVVSAGHFKQTRKGAWIEAIINLVISIILVNKFGIVGVAIGTIVAMIVRTIEFVCYSNKVILKRRIFNSCIKFFVAFIEIVLIVFIYRFLPNFENVSYLNWLLNACVVFFESLLITMLFNLIIYKKHVNDIIKFLKRNLK